MIFVPENKLKIELMIATRASLESSDFPSFMTFPIMPASRWLGPSERRTLPVHLHLFKS